MRYNMFVSGEEWTEWKEKLGRFGTYYERAAQLLQAELSRPTLPVTPTYPEFPQKLHSPPSANLTASPHRHYSPHPNFPGPVPHYTGSPAKHYRNPLLEQIERKRSIDYSNDLPPVKRTHYNSNNVSPTNELSTMAPTNLYPNNFNAQIPGSFAQNSNSFSAPPVDNSNFARLPIPRIHTNVMPPHPLAPLSIPTSRAMSTVYHPTSATSWSQPATPNNLVPLNTNPYNYSGLSVDGTKDLTPFSSTYASPSYQIPTPSRPGLSPSYFLTHRSSPYRPVRAVNTLLNYPPSASLANPAGDVRMEQIHYQPLSKAASDIRYGPLPYHYPEGIHPSNASTPMSYSLASYQL